MWVLQAIGLFLAAAAWRLTGSKRFGEVLIRSLSAENENLKNIAGILIVRAGKNAESASRLPPVSSMPCVVERTCP